MSFSTSAIHFENLARHKYSIYTCLYPDIDIFIYNLIQKGIQQYREILYWPILYVGVAVSSQFLEEETHDEGGLEYLMRCRNLLVGMLTNYFQFYLVKILPNIISIKL